jgi:hypothetical protein
VLQKRKLERKWGKLRRRTTKEIMQVSDRLLLRIESDRARTTGMKGQIGGSIKEAVHLLREANRAIGQRAFISGDAHYWMERARKLEEELARVRTEQEKPQAGEGDWETRGEVGRVRGGA